MLPSRDQHLVQIVDAALADTALRSGEWLVCRPGCTQCCVGAFAISQLDAERLRTGLRQLEATDPQRAARILERVHLSVSRIAADFPGNVHTGILEESPEAQEQFADFANDEVCPVLDPETGMCDLYTARPMTCRVFGPPVRSEDGLGVCELCYHDASEDEIAACEMHLGTDALEAELESQVETETGQHGNTIVAFALHR
ncbi:YkgJ family cysteine cluster protein [Alloacidobacterium dinghuense]|uniref:YkgJ family cysteine cluster protein n=1 Tax=Alloacidobacterium dinghuense TaxID=2763107 RepID=A0A7G8BCI8_9BACT|nr:YkgJ family cysteine cluster protein [Alloacidobacterium dinghuense]QNI30258.1 YkgJ family cysteine cluster protein [Alloacidobacterium dinghuense]